MKNILLIDTSSNKEIKVGIKIDGIEHRLSQKVDFRKTQIVLPMIDKLLSRSRIHLKDIDTIQVNTNRGSFTGIRIGIAIANALSYTLKMKVKF